MTIPDAEQTAQPPERIPAEMADEHHYFRPPHGWTCFHCGDTFTTPGAARDHFGADPLKDPACRIKVGEERGLVMALRRAEEELERYRCEDSDADRAMAALRSDHAQALISEEEKGYARGVADARRDLAAEIWPPALTEPLAEILGMPNFRAAPMAHLYRAAGHDIAPKAEAEQAFVLHRFVGFALARGEAWRDFARADLLAAQRTVLEKREAEAERAAEGFPS